MAHKSFDQLKSGENGYTFNLVDVTTKKVKRRVAPVTMKDDVVGILEPHIKKIVADLQPDWSKTIEWPYYIGITSTEGQKKAILDPMDETTMKKDVISTRWSNHKGNGKDGMVLVAAITQTFAKAIGFEDDLKTSDQKKAPAPKSAAKKCALWTEEKLQKKLELRTEDFDHRTGSVSKYDEAYLLYVAYKYTTPRNGQVTKPTTSSTAYYSFNLCDLSCAGSQADAAHIVQIRIYDIKKDLEFDIGREAQLSIGHVDIDKEKDFNHMDPSTFNKKGIQEIWVNYKRQGKDGMFVVAVVTDEMARTLRYKDAHDYVRQIEIKLKRGGYTVEEKGFKAKSGAAVTCCLYFTFTYKK